MLKRKWLVAGTALGLLIPGAANAASAVTAKTDAPTEQKDLNKEKFAEKRAEMKAKLMKLVETYTPEKKDEWNQAIQKQQELRKQMKPHFEKHKEAKMDNIEKWKKKAENNKMTDAQYKGKMAKWKEKHQAHKMEKQEAMKKFHEAVQSKDKAEIQKQLNLALDRLQQHNKKMENRLKEMDKQPQKNVQ
ncbi:hypothetical protein LRR81_18425 [Metabacillus sp. GX 13764]|uniref:hypothetical protein n=1 Tax=Metabacillus kandeliae TaxID=2900151 RepID=UPI001E4446C3|nr:hypothetical protein [Metabacillus kandeliae]MCD7036223.1 hypothetical protein [Metabacillus kandeliae]